jgi:hypothetical protein
MMDSKKTTFYDIALKVLADDNNKESISKSFHLLQENLGRSKQLLKFLKLNKAFSSLVKKIPLSITFDTEHLIMQTQAELIEQLALDKLLQELVTVYDHQDYIRYLQGEIQPSEESFKPFAKLDSYLVNSTYKNFLLYLRQKYGYEVLLSHLKQEQSEAFLAKELIDYYHEGIVTSYLDKLVVNFEQIHDKFLSKIPLLDTIINNLLLMSTVINSSIIEPILNFLNYYIDLLVKYTINNDDKSDSIFKRAIRIILSLIVISIYSLMIVKLPLLIYKSIIEISEKLYYASLGFCCGLYNSDINRTVSYRDILSDYKLLNILAPVAKNKDLDNFFDSILCIFNLGSLDISKMNPTTTTAILTIKQYIIKIYNIFVSLDLSLMKLSIKLGYFIGNFWQSDDIKAVVKDCAENLVNNTPGGPEEVKDWSAKVIHNDQQLII